MISSDTALGLLQPRREAVEEDSPAGLRRRGVGGQRLALLEAHAGPAVAQVLQEDSALGVLAVLRRAVGDGEDETLGRDDLAVLAVPANLAALGAVEHRQPPRAALPQVHGDRIEGVVGVRAAVPVGEALGLGPLGPHALARGL